ncbi:hypothetical protein HMPREF0005_04487 [Achromobacter xylosoxidans C54]|nr:hypothetical protein HMPREF0005_04487 [Achromobacter xylosoxidans C54]
MVGLGADAGLAGQVQAVGREGVVQPQQRALGGAQDHGAAGGAGVDDADLDIAVLRGQCDGAVAAGGGGRGVQRAGGRGADVAVGGAQRRVERAGVGQRQVGRRAGAGQAGPDGAGFGHQRGVAARGAAAEIQRGALDVDRARRGAGGHHVLRALERDGAVGLYAGAGQRQLAARGQQQVGGGVRHAAAGVQIAGGGQVDRAIGAALLDVAAVGAERPRADVVDHDDRAVGGGRQVAQGAEVGAQRDAARAIARVGGRADAAAGDGRQRVAQDQVVGHRAEDGAGRIQADVAARRGVDRVDRQVAAGGGDRDAVAGRAVAADGAGDQGGAGGGDADRAVLGDDRCQRGAGRAVVVQVDRAGAGDFGGDVGGGRLQIVGRTSGAADARAGLEHHVVADDARGFLAVVDDGAACLAEVDVDGAGASVDVAGHQLAVGAVAGDLDRAIGRDRVGDLQIAGGRDVDGVARQVRVDGIVVRRQVHAAAGGGFDALAGRVDAAVAGADGVGGVQRHAVGLDGGAGGVGQDRTVLGVERDLAVVGAGLHILDRDVARGGLDRDVVAGGVGARGDAGQRQAAVAGDARFAIGDRGRQAAQQVAAAVQVERAVAGDGGRHRAVGRGDLDGRVARADTVLRRQRDGAGARARERAAAVQDAAGLGVQGQGVAGAIADRADQDVARGGGDRQVAARAQVAQVDRTGLFEPDATRGGGGDVLDLGVQGQAGRADRVGRVARGGGQRQVAGDDLGGRVHALDRAARGVVRVGRQVDRTVLGDVDVVYVDRADGLVGEVQAGRVAHDGQCGGIAAVGAAERQVLGVDGQEAGAAQVRALRVVADDGQVGQVGQVVDVDAAGRGHRQLLGVQMQASRVGGANLRGRAVVGRQVDALAGDQVAVVDAGDAAARGRQRDRAVGGRDGAHGQVAAVVAGVGGQRDVASRGNRGCLQAIGLVQRDAAIGAVGPGGAEGDRGGAAVQGIGADGALVADRAVGRQVDAGGVVDRAAQDRAAGVVDREGVAVGVDRAQLDVAEGVAHRAGAGRGQARQAGVALHRDERAAVVGTAAQRADAGVDGVARAGGADGVGRRQGQAGRVDLAVGVAVAQQRAAARVQRHVVVADVDRADSDAAVAGHAQVQAARVLDLGQDQPGAAAAAAIRGLEHDVAAVARGRGDAIAAGAVAGGIQRQRVDVAVGVDVDVAGVLDVHQRRRQVDLAAHGADGARALGGDLHRRRGDALAVVGAAEDAVVARQAHRAVLGGVDDADVLADVARQHQVQPGVVAHLVDLQAAAIVGHVEQQFVGQDLVGGRRRAGGVQRQAGQVAVVVQVDVAAGGQVQLAGGGVDRARVVARRHADLAAGAQRDHVAGDVRGRRQVQDVGVRTKGAQAHGVGRADVDVADVQRAVAVEREVQAGQVADLGHRVDAGVGDVERQALGRHLHHVVHGAVGVVGGDVQREQVAGVVDVQVAARLRGQLAGVGLHRVAGGADRLRGGQRQDRRDEAAGALRDRAVGHVDLGRAGGAVVQQRQVLVVRHPQAAADVGRERVDADEQRLVGGVGARDRTGVQGQRAGGDVGRAGAGAVAIDGAVARQRHRAAGGGADVVDRQRAVRRDRQRQVAGIGDVVERQAGDAGGVAQRERRHAAGADVVRVIDRTAAAAVVGRQRQRGQRLVVGDGHVAGRGDRQVGRAGLRRDAAVGAERAQADVVAGDQARAADGRGQVGIGVARGQRHRAGAGVDGVGGDGGVGVDGQRRAGHAGADRQVGAAGDRQRLAAQAAEGIGVGVEVGGAIGIAARQVQVQAVERQAAVVQVDIAVVGDGQVAGADAQGAAARAQGAGVGVARGGAVGARGGQRDRAGRDAADAAIASDAGVDAAAGGGQAYGIGGGDGADLDVLAAAEAEVGQAARDLFQVLGGAVVADGDDLAGAAADGEGAGAAGVLQAVDGQAAQHGVAADVHVVAGGQAERRGAAQGQRAARDGRADGAVRAGRQRDGRGADDAGAGRIVVADVLGRCQADLAVGARVDVADQQVLVVGGEAEVQVGRAGDVRQVDAKAVVRDGEGREVGRGDAVHAVGAAVARDVQARQAGEAVHGDVAAAGQADVGRLQRQRRAGRADRAARRQGDVAGADHGGGIAVVQ